MKSNYLFIIYTILFIIHQVLQKVLNAHIQIIDSYLDPLLFMPVLLQLIKWERKCIFKKNYYFSFVEIVIWTSSIALITEYIFPKMNDNFTADIIDVFMYFAGAMIFYFLQWKNETNKFYSITKKTKNYICKLK